MRVWIPMEYGALYIANPAGFIGSVGGFAHPNLGPFSVGGPPTAPKAKFKKNEKNQRETDAKPPRQTPANKAKDQARDSLMSLI